MDSQPAEPLLPSRARAQQDDDGEAVRCSRCRLSSCMCWCCTALCCLAAAALYFGIAVLSTWYRVHSVEPLDLLLLEGHMGCDESKLVDESFAHFGDRSISSKANDKYAAKMKNAKAADEVIRVQIINGSLFTTCAGHGAEKAASIDCTLAGLRSRGAMMVHVLRTLDLLLSIGRVPDVDFFIDLSEHACYHHQTKNAKGADAWPVLTVETDDEKRCHNILGPPRAFISLPDAGRWLSRAASDAREWAWSERIPKAVWRGSATGGDPTDKNGKLQSARGKAVAASLERPDLLSAIFAGRGGTSPGLTHTHTVAHRPRCCVHSANSMPPH